MIMGLLVAYSIKTALLLSVMFAVYMLTMSQVKDATIRRASIIGIYILSLALPLVNFSRNSEKIIVPTVQFQQIDAEAVPVSEPMSMIAFDVISILFIAGMVIMACFSLFSIILMLKFSFRAKTKMYYGYKLKIIDDKKVSPFCFGGNIYISESDYSAIPKMILAHEMSHIRHWHFIDLIIARTILILQWWNPCAWLIVRELQQVHEFQADSDVLKSGFDCKEYQYLLLSRSVGSFKVPFVSNGFKHSKLKNRLKMLNREESGKIKRLTSLILIPGAVIAVMLLSTPLVSSVTRSFSESFDNESTAENIAVTPDHTSGEPYLTINGEAFDASMISRIKTENIQEITVFKDSTKNYPNGWIDIRLKPEYTIHNSLTDEPIQLQSDSIKVIGYAVQKK